MHRAYVLLFLLALPVVADSFTATTSSQIGPPFFPPNARTCIDVAQTGMASCSTSSNNPFAAGDVFAIAGSSPDSIAIVDVSVRAGCGTGHVPDCLSQRGTASVEMDLAIYGQPAGTLGLVEVRAFTIESALVSVGLVGTGVLGPHFGDMRSFVYEQVFHLSLFASFGCSECGYPDYRRAQARVVAPFYIYDLNMNLLQTITSASQMSSVPEPGSAFLLGVGLVATILRRYAHVGYHRQRVATCRILESSSSSSGLGL